jgi:predicted O-methyltransferase YrrM
LAYIFADNAHREGKTTTIGKKAKKSQALRMTDLLEFEFQRQDYCKGRTPGSAGVAVAVVRRA